MIFHSYRSDDLVFILYRSQFAISYFLLVMVKGLQQTDDMLKFYDLQGWREGRYSFSSRSTKIKGRMNRR